MFVYVFVCAGLLWPQPVDVLFPPLWSPHHRGLQDVQESEELHHHQDGPAAVQWAAAEAGVLAAPVERHTGLWREDHGTGSVLGEDVQCEAGRVGKREEWNGDVRKQQIVKFGINVLLLLRNDLIYDRGRFRLKHRLLRMSIGDVTTSTSS